MTGAFISLSSFFLIYRLRLLDMICKVLNFCKHLTEEVDWDGEDDRTVVLRCYVVQCLQISQLQYNIETGI